MWNVSFAWGAAEWGMCHAAQEYFSRRCHRSTQNHAGCLSTTQIAPPVRRIGTDISQAERDVENVECGVLDVECGM